jgi:hypothetical protein
VACMPSLLDADLHLSQTSKVVEDANEAGTKELVDGNAELLAPAEHVCAGWGARAEKESCACESAMHMQEHVSLLGGKTHEVVTLEAEREDELCYGPHSLRQ